ncbi:MAG: AAA family ATPase, partial [Nannocystaceae bacterium]
ELLLQLCMQPPVAALLAESGVHAQQIAREHPSLVRQLDPEPADWRLRLAQRGAGKLGVSELDQLLAIVRSAECHAYQLLEHCGISCSQLRKQIIVRLRDRSTQAAKRPTPVPKRVFRRTSAQAVEAEGQPVPPKRAPTRQRSQSPRQSPRPLLPRATVEATAPDTLPVPELEAPQPVAAEVSQVTHSKPSAQVQLQPVDAATLPDLIGQHEVLARLADAVCRQSPRPPVLVGAPKSGRTLVAVHLASVISRPVYRLLASDYDDDTLREDLDQIALNSGIAIIDDLDRLATDTPPGFLTALSQAWTRAMPPVVLVTSHEGLARVQSWLPSARDTLDKIELTPLRGEELQQAIDASGPAILHHHGVSLGRNTRLSELTRLAERFLGGLAMPGRALDLLDLSCARTLREGKTTVTRETWVEIVSERTGISSARIEGHGQQEVLDLEGVLARQVVGHAPVLETLARLIRRNRAGFRSDRPVATALLLGPSGVGKTEVAKALCAALYEKPSALVRLDMSEYAESHAVARIVGAPPGYIGHERGGALTDPLRERPHCVILLDEIEKAHRDVHQLLLQVFDDGRLTDGRGRTVDFRHAIVIMTSNLGSQYIMEKFEELTPENKDALMVMIKEQVLDMLKGHLRP